MTFRTGYARLPAFRQAGSTRITSSRTPITTLPAPCIFDAERLLKLICERATFIPGLCVFLLHHNGFGVSQPARADDYLRCANRYAEWLSASPR